MNKLFVTVFYSGCAPKASGTVGTIASLPFGLLLLYLLPVETFLLLTLAIFVVGSKEIDRYQKATGKHDPKEVVIDETVGIFISLAFLPDPFVWYQVLFAFIFFRIFDITKPSIIGKIDSRLKNGVGVMLDDVLAGVFGGIATLIAIKIVEII